MRLNNMTRWAAPAVGLGALCAAAGNAHAGLVILPPPTINGDLAISLADYAVQACVA